MMPAGRKSRHSQKTKFFEDIVENTGPSHSSERGAEPPRGSPETHAHQTGSSVPPEVEFSDQSVGMQSASIDGQEMFPKSELRSWANVVADVDIGAGDADQYKGTGFQAFLDGSSMNPEINSNARADFKNGEDFPSLQGTQEDLLFDAANVGAARGGPEYHADEFSDGIQKSELVESHAHSRSPNIGSDNNGSWDMGSSGTAMTDSSSLGTPSTDMPDSTFESESVASSSKTAEMGTAGAMNDAFMSRKTDALNENAEVMTTESSDELTRQMQEDLTIDGSQRFYYSDSSDTRTSGISCPKGRFQAAVEKVAAAAGAVVGLLTSKSAEISDGAEENYSDVDETSPDVVEEEKGLVDTALEKMWNVMTGKEEFGQSSLPPQQQTNSESFGQPGSQEPGSTPSTENMGNLAIDAAGLLVQPEGVRQPQCDLSSPQFTGMVPQVHAGTPIMIPEQAQFIVSGQVPAGAIPQYFVSSNQFVSLGPQQHHTEGAFSHQQLNPAAQPFIPEVWPMNIHGTKEMGPASGIIQQ